MGVGPLKFTCILYDDDVKYIYSVHYIYIYITYSVHYSSTVSMKIYLLTQGHSSSFEINTPLSWACVRYYYTVRHNTGPLSFKRHNLVNIGTTVYLHENFRQYSRGNATFENLKIILIKCSLLAAV